MADGYPSANSFASSYRDEKEGIREGIQPSRTSSGCLSFTTWYHPETTAKRHCYPCVMLTPLAPPQQPIHVGRSLSRRLQEVTKKRNRSSESAFTHHLPIAARGYDVVLHIYSTESSRGQVKILYCRASFQSHCRVYVLHHLHWRPRGRRPQEVKGTQPIIRSGYCSRARIHRQQFAIAMRGLGSQVV